MVLENYYWYFKSVIPERICDMIVKYGKVKKEDEEIAITGLFGEGRDLKKNPLTKKEEKDLKKKRDSNVVWMNDKWIYKEIMPYVHMANRNASWNFTWEQSETCQFTKYSKGQYYDWHPDSWIKPYQNGSLKGLIRKLSVTVTLSDAKDYKGGELEFDFKHQEPGKKQDTRICTEILPKGSLVVFPSFLWHRVKPVTEGIRYSLVIWNSGYPFK
jgi:PKHD-type hydroxylase